MMSEGVTINNMDASNEMSMDGVQESGESISKLSASLLIIIGEIIDQKYVPAVTDRLRKGTITYIVLPVHIFSPLRVRFQAFPENFTPHVIG